MRYIGLDVGKRYVQACLLNEDDMAVLESTGNLWVRIYDLLRDRVLMLVVMIEKAI